MPLMLMLIKANHTTAFVARRMAPTRMPRSAQKPNVRPGGSRSISVAACVAPAMTAGRPAGTTATTKYTTRVAMPVPVESDARRSLRERKSPNKSRTPTGAKARSVSSTILRRWRGRDVIVS